MGISSTQDQHEILDVPPVVVCERRKFPDRRTVWRGGRRDTDWIDRPSGAWERFEAEQRRGWRFTLLLKQPARLRLSVIAALLLLANVTAIACSGSPTAPDLISDAAAKPFGASASPRSYSETGAFATFPLLSGSFRLTFSGGDYIAGTYTGSASVSIPGPDPAVLSFDVRSGSGAFQGAKGTLTGDGNRAFSGEGDFTLLLKGVLRTKAEPEAFAFHANIRGTSRGLPCADGRIALTLDGDGSAGRFGAVRAALRHEVGNTFCF